MRVLSATHKNLSALVAAGRFREDLYYRINVIEIHVPALREHAGDIPELAATLLRRLGRRLGGDAPELGAEALAALETYAFPGNVRELENILERALTLCAGQQHQRGRSAAALGQRRRRRARCGARRPRSSRRART